MRRNRKSVPADKPKPTQEMVDAARAEMRKMCEEQQIKVECIFEQMYKMGADPSTIRVEDMALEIWCTAVLDRGYSHKEGQTFAMQFAYGYYTRGEVEKAKLKRVQSENQSQA